MRQNHLPLFLAVALLAGCSEDPFTAASNEAAADNVAVRGNPRTADLALDLRADNLSPAPGEPFTLSLAVRNKGPHFTTRVSVDFPIPDGTELLGYTSSSQQSMVCCPDDSLSWMHFYFLPVNSEVMLDIVLTARNDWGEKPIVARSVISGSLLRDPNPDNNRSVVVVEPRRRAD